MRVLPSGEVFRTMGTDLLTGADRRGPLWTHALSAISFRLPSMIWEGEGGPEYRFIQSYPISETARIDAQWRLAYLSAKAIDCDGESCYRFTYKAAITEKGIDSSVEHAAELVGEGIAEGTIKWRQRDGAVLDHSYTWSTERTITLMDGQGKPVNEIINRLNTEVTVNWLNNRRSVGL